MLISIDCLTLFNFQQPCFIRPRTKMASKEQSEDAEILHTSKQNKIK